MIERWNQKAVRQNPGGRARENRAVYSENWHGENSHRGAREHFGDSRKHRERGKSHSLNHKAIDVYGGERYVESEIRKKENVGFAQNFFGGIFQKNIYEIFSEEKNRHERHDAVRRRNQHAVADSVHEPFVLRGARVLPAVGRHRQPEGIKHAREKHVYFHSRRNRGDGVRP